jgi:SulP family sulfate permease
VLSGVGSADGATLAVGVVALVLLFGAERVAPRLPAGLIALALGILVSAALDLSDHGVAVVGHVPSGLPSVGVPDLATSDVLALAAVAAGMVLVMFSESLGAAQTFATKHGYEIDADQEMVALGVANLGSGLVGGLAAGGSLSQTAVNEGAGARSELSPMVAALLALITVVALTPLFTELPEAVLAALIIHAVSHLWKIKEFRRYRALAPAEFWLGLATLAGLVTLDVLPGLIIGVCTTLLLGIYRSSRPHLGRLGTGPTRAGGYGNLARHPDYRPVPGLEVLRLDAPLFYANAMLVRDHIKKIVGAADPLPSAVVLDIGVNAQLDITSCDMLVELADTLRAAGVDLALAEVHGPVGAMVVSSGVLAHLGADRVFRTLDAAVEALGDPTGDIAYS